MAQAKDVFSFSRQYLAASEYMLALERLLIDAELEWTKVFQGDFPDDEVLERRRPLMLLQHGTQQRAFPNGLPPQREALMRVAQQEAERYLTERYLSGS
jgi:hypothetical protein